MLDLLRKTNLGQEQKGLVNCMEVSANALICLVSNVLDQSRLEAGKVKYRRYKCACMISSIESMV